MTALMRRSLVALALLALAALPVTGCGGSDAGTTPLPAVTSLNQVASTTEKAGSYRFDRTMRMSFPGQSEPFEITADGAVDDAGRRASMSMDLSAIADLAGGMLGDVSADDLRMDMVFDWPVMYMRMPLLAKQIPGGKQWVRLDVQQLAKQQGIELPGVGSLGQSDPTAFLDFLKAATADLRNLGEAEIDGVRTTHYLARIDFERFVKTLPKAQREQLEPALVQLKQLTAGGQLSPLVDAWVDADGLLRRFAMSLSLPAGTQQADMKLQMDLHDFGTAVDVSPPPAADVADFAQLAGAG
jgi:hypothetical protein